MAFHLHLSKSQIRRRRRVLRAYWVRTGYGAKMMAFGEAAHRNRKAARARYRALGHPGRVELERTKMKRRGKKYAPPPPPKCTDCNDDGYWIDWQWTFDGPEQFERPCHCIAPPLTPREQAALDARLAAPEAPRLGDVTEECPF